MVTANSIMPPVTVGDPIAFRNLVMFPLIGGAAGEPDYVTLDAALNGKTARVTEVSAGGSVPELRFVNTGDAAVLLIDGEELIGAKQNRVLNLTILAPAHSELVIPVSCVEAGRWFARDLDFAPSPHTHHPRGRAGKAASVSQSLRAEGSRRSDQGQVWEEVASLSQRLGVRSPTSAMFDVYSDNSRSLGEYAEAFQPVDGQAGALFAINGRTAGMDLFDHHATLARVLPKLVRSYALDAIGADRASERPAVREDAESFLKRIEDAHVETYPAIGEGTDLRFEGPGITGAALRARDRIVHLTAFHWGGRSRADEPGTICTRMSRASFRGRPQTA